MWIALFGFGTFFLSYATLVFHGEHMGLSAVTAGTVLAIMMVAVVAIQPLVPLLHARFGPRVTFGLALTFQAIGHLVSLWSAVPLLALLSGSIISGIGFGILVVVGTATVPTTVSPARLGRALGFFGMTTASATALGAPIGLWLSTLLPSAQFRWLSFGLVLLAVPALLAVPTKTAGQQQASDPPDTQQPVHFTGLATVLAPAALILTVFGLILAFGPAAEVASPAVYIASMQVVVIIGRFIGSALLDRYPAQLLMALSLGISILGLCFTALLPAGPGLLVAMMILGFGTGGVQAASLLLAFQQAGSANRGSVVWNMTFDIGLGVAGLVGGIGFTYLGPTMTYLWCAGVLVLATIGFLGYFFRRPQRV